MFRHLLRHLPTFADQLPERHTRYSRPSSLCFSLHCTTRMVCFATNFPGENSGAEFPKTDQRPEFGCSGKIQPSLKSCLSMVFFQVAVFTYCGRSVDFVGSVGLVGSAVDPVSSIVVGGGVTVVQLSHMLSSPIALKLKGNRDIPLIDFNSRFESNHISQNEMVIVVDHSVDAVLVTVTSSSRRVS
jgi:hypothetical protein